MRRAFLILIVGLLLGSGAYGQRSYNYSRRYTTTARHTSNKAAMKKALSKKRMNSKKPAKPIQKMDTAKRKP